MTAIVGNSKNIKLAQHHLILIACCGFKGDRYGALSHLKSLTEILDNIKINKDLYKEIFLASLNVVNVFGIESNDKVIQRCDQVLKVLGFDQVNPVFEVYQHGTGAWNNVCSVLNVKVGHLFASGKLDESIAATQNLLLPARLASLNPEHDLSEEDKFNGTMTQIYEYTILLELLKKKNNIEEGMVAVNNLKKISAQAKQYALTQE